MDLNIARKILKFGHILDKSPNMDSVYSVLDLAEYQRNVFAPSRDNINIANARRAYVEARDLIQKQVKKNLKEIYDLLKDIKTLISNARKEIAVLDSHLFISLRGAFDVSFSEIETLSIESENDAKILGNSDLIAEINEVRKIIFYYNSLFEQVEQDRESLSK